MNNREQKDDRRLDEADHLPEAVYERLLEKGATCAFAESCTGGLVSALMTRVPGASDVFVGGVVSYTNAMKRKALGVSESLLATEGPVSESCARAMAEGLRRLTGADYAVSVTGFAGPSGGTPAHPVGTVFIACCDAKGTRTDEHHYRGSRADVRRQAARDAFDLLLRSVALS